MSCEISEALKRLAAEYEHATTQNDEYVALVNARGLETKAEIEFSDLQNVKARLASALPAGEYTLKVHTRSGLGDQYGVHVATRKVMVA